MKETVAVAVSGGVDSLVTAHLLKKAGHPLFGIHFITGYEGYSPGILPDRTDSASPFPLPGDHPVRAVGKALGIETFGIDCRACFKEIVVEDFIDSYKEGKTPNPCMRCNRLIKFGVLLAASLRLGADRLATGHYALLGREADGLFSLRKGRDPKKEQSYFLALLEQERLARALFPLGALTKREVRKIASENRLSGFAVRESQDICFTKGRHYLDFMTEHADCISGEGPIVDSGGRVLGTHQGLHRYTVGQRRGINCPASEPLYVLRLDISKNRLIVGPRKDLYQPDCSVRDVNWIRGKPDRPLSVTAKIRYRHDPVQAEIEPRQGHRAVIRFQRPQPAVTPGQGAVCYQGEEVVAGGWIDG
jgi:tRNA-specific 2-thiouridylase